VTRVRRPRPILVVALLALVVGTAAGALIADRESRGFRSSTALTLDQTSVLDPNAGADAIAKLSRLRALFVDFASTTLVRERVASDLHESPQALEGELRAVAPETSLVLLVEADASTSGEAERRLTSLIKRLKELSDQRQAAVAPRDRLQLVQLRAPGPGVALERTTRSVVSTGLLVGLAAAGLVLALATLGRPIEA
jgi:hypothetical protein